MTTARHAQHAAIALLLTALVGTSDASTGPRWDGARLAGFADVILMGRVAEVRSGIDPAVNGIYTYVTVQVARVLKGDVPADRILVKQLGGQAGTRGLRVHGQPLFLAGEEVLLFLEARPRDRSLYTVAGWQGKWLIERQSGGPTAVREFERSGIREHWPLDAVEAVVRHAGDARAPAAPIDTHPADAAGAVIQPYVLFNPAFRFSFSPFVDAQAGGQPGLAGGGLAEIYNSMLRWNNAGSSIAFRAGSSSGPARCFNNELGNSRVTISFNDPCQEISDTGGTLALGGAYYDTSRSAFVNGILFYEATEGFVVTNDGPSAAPYLRNSNCFSDIQLHELGHVLGLDHTSVAGAIMYPTLNSGCALGARGLAPDDVAGLLRIYPAGGVTPPTSAPSNVTVAVNGSTSITVSFDAVTTDVGYAASAATSYRVDFARSATGPVVYSVPAATTSITIPIPPGLTGIFFVSVAGVNLAGSGPNSARIAFSVGACALPAAPTGLIAGVVGGVGSAAWNASPDATSYIVQAGTTPGASDLGTANIGNATSATVGGLPPGFSAYVRVFAVNPCGISLPTPDVLLR